MANEDRPYLQWVRMQPCMSCGICPCHAHHVGKHAMGRRNHDWLAVPLCSTCHMLLHDGKLGSAEERMRREMQWAATTMARFLKDTGIPF